jgi:hypothetical protein
VLRQIQTFEAPSFYSIAEVADVLTARLGRRIRPGAVRYLFECGKVADVRRAGGKRVFTDDDVERIREALER